MIPKRNDDVSDGDERESAAEWVATESLKAWGDNPRINDAAVAQVAASIKRFGFGAPILARRADNEVIAGHTRLLAALALKLPKVPVRFLDLDPADAHLLALADNKTAEIAEWNEQLLGAVLGDLRQKDLDLTTGTGFSDADIERLIEGPAFGAGDIDDQGKLDEKAEVTCPQCGHTFHPPV